VLAPAEEITTEEALDEGRTEVPELPIAQRLKNFKLVELGLDEKAAIREAKRCLRCDLEERE
jgi:hypothetical protein